MADFVLLLQSHFGKSFCISFGYEDGIVSKSVVSSFLRDDCTFYHTLKKIFPAIQHQGDDCSEPSFSIRYFNHLTQNLIHIGIHILIVTCISGRIYSRTIFQGGYLQTTVIGKTVFMIILVDETSLLKRISLQSIMIFL